MGRNTSLLYGVSAAKWALISMPIFVVYLLSKGLTLTEIFLLQSVYAGFIFLFEIPTGYLSDRGNRKHLLILAFVVRAAGKFLYSEGDVFLDFAISESLIALSMALMSGTDVAMLYDSLAEEQQHSHFKKIESKRIAVGQMSAALGGLVCGIFAAISLSAPFVAEGVVSLIMAGLLFFATEPKRFLRKDSVGTQSTNLSGIVRYSLIEDHSIRWLIFLTGSLLASVSVMAFLAQPYMQIVGIPVEYFGYVWCYSYAVAAVAGALCPYFEERLGIAGTLKTMALAPGAVLILLSFVTSYWVIGLVAVFYAIRALAYAISRSYINELVGSDIRATVLSVKGSVARLCFTVLGPIVGILGDVLGVQASMFICGCFFLLVTVLLCSLFLRSHDKVTSLKPLAA